MVLKKTPLQARHTPDDLKVQRFAELEAAYKQQMRNLRTILRSARGGSKPLKRDNKA